MKLSLNTNIGSIKAQNQLLKANEGLAASFERLSSGLRINRASDDPAGLAMAGSLQADSRLMAQAVRNVNDGIGLLNIAEASLKAISNVLLRQGELAEQAANGTYSLAQRKALSNEATELNKEINRILQTTEFNGLKLWEDPGSETSVQAGHSTLSLNLGDALGRTVGDGTFTAQGSFATGGAPWEALAVDLNEDGYLDFVTADQNSKSLSVFLGNGDGTFKTRAINNTSIFTQAATYGDFNNDNKLDLLAADTTTDSIAVLLGNGNGTFQAARSYSTSAQPWQVTTGDLNGDGLLDLVTTSYSGSCFGVQLGNGNGTFATPISWTSGGTPTDAVLADFNEDGILDIAVTSHDFGQDINVRLGVGNGSFGPAMTLLGQVNPMAVAAEDFNGDGFVDLVTGNRTADSISVFIGDGSGNFSSAINYATGIDPKDVDVADINVDGFADIITTNFDDGTATVFLSNGDGTFCRTDTLAAGTDSHGSAVGDFTGDGVPDVITVNRGDNTANFFIANTEQVISAVPIYLDTIEHARDALVDINESLERVTAELGNIGAQQSRLSHAVNHLQTMRENYAAANSKIVDADIAEEVAQMVRQQILQQAITAVMAQANQQPALVSQLLK